MTLVPRPDSSSVFNANPVGFSIAPPPEANAPSPTAADLYGAAFRQENMIGSLMAGYRDPGGPADPSYSPWDDIKGTAYADHWERFADGAFNRGQTDALKAQIDRETADQRTIAAGGGWGMLTSIGAGIFSPENLIPFGEIYRGARIGNTVVRSAINTAAAAAAATSVSEMALQATQVTRTPQQSVLNIGSAALLGGMLGAGTSALFTRGQWAKAASGMDQEGLAAADSAPLAANERAMLDGINNPSSAGAAARPVDTLDDMTIAGRAAQVVGGATRGLNPVLRVLHSPSTMVRDIGTRLFENPVYLKREMEGATPGPAVETLVKEFTQGRVANAIEQSNSVFADYRKAGGGLNRSDFNDAVGQAMRRADQNADPNITRAAEVWRREVFDPLKDKAIDAGLLPKDVAVEEAPSYFTRVYNRPAIEAREAEFKGIVRQHIDEAVRSAEFKKDEIGIGNKIVDADSFGIKWRAAFDRLSSIDDRLAGRAAVRQRKLADLNEAGRLRFDAQKERPPLELIKRLRNADANESMVGTLRDLRAAERGANVKAPYRDRFPMLSRIKAKGGVKVGSYLDHELRNMGITPQSHPGLFKAEGGLGAVDNIPWDDEPFFQDNFSRAPDGYLDQNHVLDAIRNEAAGAPLRTPEQIAAEENLNNLESHASKWLEDVGLPPDSTVGDARGFIKRITGAEKQVDDLDARIARMERDLDGFDEATDAVANERTISEVEVAKLQSEMDKLDEEILQVRDIANASPRVQMIVDYASTRRDLYKGKIDASRLRRRVDALRTIRDEGRANDAMMAELGAKSTDLTRVLDKIDKLAGKADKLQPMVPRMKQELPDFVNEADRKAYIEEIVGNIFNTVTGKNADGDIPREIVAATRGPLKERTFHIPDAKIEPFLESNVEAVGRRYARSMASDVELTNAFGRADLRDQIDGIRREYATLRQQVQGDVDGKGQPLAKPLNPDQKDKAIRALASREKHDVEDIRALRDMMRGTYLAGANSTNFARAARVAGTVNYLRSMGGVTLSSATDIARHAMVHGFSGVMRDGLVPLIGNLRAFKMSAKEGRLAGTVTERLLNTRMATWAEITDPYSVSSPFERFMENTANGFSKLNGMVYWNDFQKSFASVITQNRILRNAGGYEGIGQRETAYMAYLGIDRNMAERIAGQFEKHGTEETGGVRVANTDAWDDEWARRVYRAAINKDVDSTIVTKGIGDVPLFMHTPTGKLLGQFKGFAIASHQRVLMRGLQERPTGFLSGSVFAATVGMMIYYLKAVEANRTADLSDNPGRWIAEGLDRSGTFAIAFEANNTIEKAFNIGAYGALQSLFPGAGQGGKASRYATRSEAAALLGPTGDLIDTAVRAFQAIKGSGNGMTEGDVNSIKRLVPFATLPGIRSLVEYAAGPAVKRAAGLN